MNRRNLIKGLMAAGPILGFRNVFAETAKNEVVKTCRLITQDIAGPYRTADIPFRSDITGGQTGTPLTLNFQVMDSFRCQPVAGAMVSIWHANAEGLYSGVNNLMLTADMQSESASIDTSGQNFLRGTQKTDADGRVSFKTIYPGWYYPRATHAHIMVFPPNYGEVATTQLYFSDDVCDQVYQAEHYAHRGPNPVRTDPSADSPTDGTDEGDLWLDLRHEGGAYVANHNLGVTYYGDMFGELPGFYEQS